MQLWKNNEIKRITIVFLFVLLIFIASSFIATTTIINSYKNYFLNYNARVLNAIALKYPEMDQSIIDEILNNGQASTSDLELLNKYGISESSLLSSVDAVKEEYDNVLYVNMSLTIGLFLFIIIVIFVFLTKLYKKISNLSAYTLKIMNGNSNIDIIDNNEGEISILKNRLYDITRILKENNELLEKDKLSLKTAIADISHQLKTPLTSLYLCNEILQDEKDIHQRKVFFNKMHQELERIEWLISALLKMSKLDSKTVTLKKDKIKVCVLVDDILSSLSNMINNKQIDIGKRGLDDVTIIGDYNWMREAISNIIKNSIEHTNKKGNIEISYEDNPLYTEIKILDNGEGISKEDMPYIFNRFYKAKGSSKESIGIGLALSKTIINSLNGNVSVKSRKNEYTVFTIKMYKN